MNTKENIQQNKQKLDKILQGYIPGRFEQLRSQLGIELFQYTPEWDKKMDEMITETRDALDKGHFKGRYGPQSKKSPETNRQEIFDYIARLEEELMTGQYAPIHPPSGLIDAGNTLKLGTLPDELADLAEKHYLSNPKAGALSSRGICNNRYNERELNNEPALNLALKDKEVFQIHMQTTRKLLDCMYDFLETKVTR
ncbi:MAG: hypothetical protein ACMXX5_00615 [Candidatus Woesearchaeota archaeon]